MAIFGMAIKGVKCPKCGFNTVECEHWENGSYTGGYNDNYRHSCKNLECDYSEESLDNYGGQVGQEGLGSLICPMCKTNHCSK